MKKREIIEIPARSVPEEKELHGQLRVAAYCRVSTSLEAQQTAIRRKKTIIRK